MKPKLLILLITCLGVFVSVKASQTIVIKRSTTTWTNQPVTVTVENFEQYEKMQYQVTGDDWKSLQTSTFQVEKSTQVRLEGQNKETGTMETQTVVVDNIDTELPTLIFTPDQQSNYQMTQDVTMHPEDSGGSGVKNYRYRISQDNGKNYGPFETIMGSKDTTITLHNDGINEIHAVIEDNAGNIRNVYSGVYYIRNAKPSVPKIVLKTPEWTNQFVKLGIEVADDITHVEYKIKDGMWTTLNSNTMIVNNNTTITVRTMNHTMQYSEETSIDITNIDKELPSVEFQEETTGEVIRNITLIPVDNQSGVKNYRYRILFDQQSVEPIWNVVTDNQAITIPLTKTAQIEVEVMDHAGNQQIVKSARYDVEEPIVEPPIISLANDNWTGTGVYVVVKTPPNIERVEWRTETIDWTTLTGFGFFIHQNEMVYARSVSTTGKYSEEVTLEVTKNDKELPTGTFDIPEAKGVDHVTTTFTPTDDVSGVKNMFYCISKNDQPCGNDWISPDWINLQSADPYTFELTEPGIQRICVRVHDIAMNYQRICSGIFELTEHPKKPQIILSTTEWTNQPVIATIQAESDEANQLYYRFGNDPWQPYTNPLKVTKNTSLQAKNQSSSGQLTETTLTIENIDTSEPTGYFEVRDRDEAKTFLTRFDAVDLESGIKQLRYQVSHDNGVSFSDWITSDNPSRFEVILREEGQNKLRVEVTDLAGNQTIIYSETLNITTKPPKEPELTIDPNGTDQKQIIKVITNTDLVRLEYKIGTGLWMPLPSNQIEVYQNATIYVRGYNKQNQVSKLTKVEIDRFEEPAIDLAQRNGFFGITTSISYS